MTNLVVVALILLYLIPIILLLGMTSLDSIAKVWPEFKSYAEHFPTVKALVLYVFPSILTFIFMTLLPYGIYAISKWSLPFTKSRLERSATVKVFYFLIFNVLLVFVAGGSTLNSLIILSDQPSNIVKLMATKLPEQSSFFFVYVTLALCLFAIELLQFVALFRWLISKFITSTPRQAAARFKPHSHPYYINIPYQTL